MKPQLDGKVSVITGGASGLGAATPEHAIRNLLDDLFAAEPYVITHGSQRTVYRQRRDAMDAAFDRMEST